MSHPDMVKAKMAEVSLHAPYPASEVPGWDFDW